MFRWRIAGVIMRHRSVLFALGLLTASLPMLGLQCGGPLECIDDSDCTGGADYCNAGGVCVDCIDDDDCDAGESCQDGSCGAFAGEGEGEGEGEPGTDAEIIEAFCVHSASCGANGGQSAAQCIADGTEAIGGARESGIAICNEIADAQLDAVICMTALTCPQLNEGLLGELCGAEIAAVEELVAQAGNACSGGEGEGEPEPEPFCLDAPGFLPASGDGPVVFGSQVVAVPPGGLCDASEQTVRLIVEHADNGVVVARVLASFDGETVVELFDLRFDVNLVEGVLCAPPDTPVELIAFQLVNENGDASRVTCVNSFIGEEEGEGEGEDPPSP